MIRLAVQQRDRFVRDALGLLFTPSDDVRVVGMVSEISDMIELCVIERPDVALVDLDAGWRAEELAGLGAGAGTVRLVGLRREAVRNDPTVQALVALGCGVRQVPAAAGVTAVLEAVRSPGPTRSGDAMRGAQATGPAGAELLSSRERDILVCVGRGFTARETSERLGISPKTVENHKRRIFEKLGVQNQSHAVALCIRAGVLNPSELEAAAPGRV
jgi:DNA-binding NarL/FixJ family response regulator